MRVELEKPLEYIQLAVKENYIISNAFEPEKNGYTSAQLPSIFSENPTLLERWYEFGRIDWVSELEYPEWTNKEVNRFLQY